MFRPDFITLRIFLSVYNLGNISKAAERENIASSAISKRIQSLEVELGAPGRGVRQECLEQVAVAGGLAQVPEVMMAIDDRQVRLDDLLRLGPGEPGTARWRP